MMNWLRVDMHFRLRVRDGVEESLDDVVLTRLGLFLDFFELALNRLFSLLFSLIGVTSMLHSLVHNIRMGFEKPNLPELRIS